MTANVKYIFLLLIFCTGPKLYAQKQGQERLDSLLAVLPKLTEEDTSRAALLIDISYTYKNTDPSKGIKYGKEGLQLAEQLNWKKGMAKGNNCLGNNYKASSDYPAALKHYLEALKIYEAIDEQKSIPIIMMNIGTVYWPMHEYARSLEYYEKALPLATKLGNKKLCGLLYGNISVVYAEQGDYRHSTEYNKKALKIFEELDDRADLAWITENLGSDHAKAGDPEAAITYYEKALVMTRELNDRKDEASVLECIGLAYRDMARSAGVAARNRYLQQSITYFNKAKDILTEINDLDYLRTSYYDLSTTMEQMGDHKQALENYKKYAALNDSVFSTDNRLAIAKLSTQKAEMDSEQQVKINRILNSRRKKEISVLAGGMLLLLVITGFVFRERRRSDKLLLNILPSEVASELKHKGSAEAKYYNNVTVLFTDFVNFTALSEKMQPQQLVDELHDCFKAFDAIITKHGIEKIKTVGDAYLAVAGLPVANTKHAYNMVSAALEIRDFITERNRRGNTSFEVRIGINSGSVVAGIVGVKKFAYDIWGDTVNTAARMEQHSEPGKVNISQDTYELVKDQFTCTHRGDIEAKNKGRLHMYFVEGKLS